MLSLCYFVFCLLLVTKIFCCSYTLKNIKYQIIIFHLYRGKMMRTPKFYNQELSFICRVKIKRLCSVGGTVVSIATFQNKEIHRHAVFRFIFSFFLSFFFLLQWILSYIEMNQPWVYMCSPSRPHLPPPSPPDPSRSSQCTGSERLSHASNLGW